MKKYYLNTYYNNSDKYLPEYELWIRMSYWQHTWYDKYHYSEPFMLILNTNPGRDVYCNKYGEIDNLDYLYKVHNLDGDVEGNEIKFYRLFEELNKLDELLQRSINSGELDIEKVKINNVFFYRIKPHDFIFWARNKGLQIPEPFTLLFKETSVVDDIYPKILTTYLDPSHKCYSRELATAVKAWEFLFVGGVYNITNRDPRRQVEEWLEKNIRWIKHGKDMGRVKARIVDIVLSTGGSGSDKTDKRILPYLDPSYKYYSVKLHAAIRCWLALFENETYDSHQSIKKQILMWLDTEYEGVPWLVVDKNRNNIASVIKPSRTIGRPLKHKKRDEIIILTDI